MSSITHDKIRHQILVILYKVAQEKPEQKHLGKDAIQQILVVTREQLDFNILYLKEKGLVRLQSVMSGWLSAEITAFGIDVVENKERYGDEFPFIRATIQTIQGDVYGTVVQAVESQVSFTQQVTDVFQQARKITETKTDIPESLREEIKNYLSLLEEELKRKEPDVGKIQTFWKSLKRNANWVIPTLTQIVLEGLKRAL